MYSHKQENLHSSYPENKETRKIPLFVKSDEQRLKTFGTNQVLYIVAIQTSWADAVLAVAMVTMMGTVMERQRCHRQKSNYKHNKPKKIQSPWRLHGECRHPPSKS